MNHEAYHHHAPTTAPKPLERTRPKDGTQAARVLKALEDARGEWISGTYFLRTLYLSQYHARIFEIQNRFGWPIEASDDTDIHGFKKYRLPISDTLF
jgi:hypothetical protein